MNDKTSSAGGVRLELRSIGKRFGTREEAVEILLQLPSGERRALVQAKGNETFVPGEAVILVSTGGKTRVMKAVNASNAAVPAAAPAR